MQGIPFRQLEATSSGHNSLCNKNKRQHEATEERRTGELLVLLLLLLLQFQLHFCGVNGIDCQLTHIFAIASPFGTHPSRNRGQRHHVRQSVSMAVIPSTCHSLVYTASTASLSESGLTNVRNQASGDSHQASAPPPPACHVPRPTATTSAST